MKLYFTCLKTQETFATEEYSLQKDHRIVTGKHGDKVLQGTVILNIGCPLCGRRHEYAAEDIGCPIDYEKNKQ